jgi:hypothetical protein
MEGLQPHAIAAVEQQLAARREHRPRAALDQRPTAGEARQYRLQMFAAQPARRVEFGMAGHGWRSWGAGVRH